MAASNSVFFANLLSQNEALTMANLQLQHVVNSSKKLRFRQEILAKQQELRIKELEASIETQAAENSIWATQVDQILVTVNRQIEKAVTSLRARSAGDREALLPRSTPATINEQRINPAPRVFENLVSRLTTTSKDGADMNPTHRPSKTTYQCHRAQGLTDSSIARGSGFRLQSRRENPCAASFSCSRQHQILDACRECTFYSF